MASRPRGSLQSGFDLDKPLYTISVASEILETHPRTLMLYEDVGLIEPFRTTTNRRRYSQRDIRKLQVIQHLTREKGVNLRFPPWARPPFCRRSNVFLPWKTRLTRPSKSRALRQRGFLPFGGAQ